MMWTRSCLLGSFLPLLAPGAFSQGANEVRIDDAMLKRVAAEVLPEIEKATGVDLDGKVRLRLAKPEALGRVVEKDMMAMAAVADGDEASARIRMVARAMRRMLLAKFDWREGEILFCPDNFAWQARVLKKPELNTEATFRAVVIHECVHAADEHRLQWSKKFMTLPNQRRVEIYNAVVEGHAQQVAAGICKANGWSKGFETFTSTIGQDPPGLAESDRLMSQVRTANMQAAYRDGRRFMEFVQEKKGEEGIRRAFQAPPEDFESILRPEWYLDPTKRPARIYDLEKPIEQLIEDHEAGWKPRETTMSPAQLKAGMSLLEPEHVERMLKHMRQNRAVVLQDKARPRSHMIIVALLEFDSPVEAKFYVLAGERLSRAKDEKMTKGMIRITDARYEPIRREDWQGIYFEKDMRVGLTKTKIYSLLGAKGSVAVEILYNNEETDRPGLEKTATVLLERSQVKQKASVETKDTPKKRADR